MSIEKLETNPEQFKVNKVGLSRRNKFALQNSNTFDCQDCYNVITTYQNPNELIFANALTGLTNTVQMPSGYSAQGHIAKFDNTFWINGGAIINEFTIGANCNITHVRTIDISSLSSLPVRAWEVNGLCAMDINTLIIGTFIDINDNEGVHLIDITPGVQPSTTFLFYHGLIPNHPGGPIAGDIAYLPTSDTLVTITGTSNSTFTAYHHDMSGGLLGSTLVVTNPLQIGAAGPFNAWSFDDKAYLSTVNNPGGQNYVTYEFDLTSYTLIPHTPTVIGYGDAASSPSPCAKSSNECYNIGDTGPGGGIIFSVPLGHPQNNGVNQTNFYYEVAKNDINVGGAIPSSIYNQSCGDPIKQIVTVDASWFGQNYPNTSNTQDITFDFGPGTANPSFDPQNLNIGATVQALDAQGNNMFPPNTTVTNKTFFPSTPNIVLVEFDTPLNVLPNGVQLLSTQISTIKFGITITAAGISAAGNEFGAHDKTIQTSINFGTGQDNTDTIHSYPITPGIHPTLSSRQIAATVCLNHSSTGTYLGQPFTAGDWFLPSLGEFEEIQNQMTLGNIPGVSFKPVNTQTHEHVYWTSSAFRNNQFPGFTMPGPDRWAWVYRSTSSGPIPIVPNLAFRCHPLSVRPIRRFECEPIEPPVEEGITYDYRLSATSSFTARCQYPGAGMISRMVDDTSPTINVFADAYAFSMLNQSSASSGVVIFDTTDLVLAIDSTTIPTLPSVGITLQNIPGVPYSLFGPIVDVIDIATHPQLGVFLPTYQAQAGTNIDTFIVFNQSNMTSFQGPNGAFIGQNYPFLTLVDNINFGGIAANPNYYPPVFGKTLPRCPYIPEIGREKLFMTISSYDVRGNNMRDLVSGDNPHTGPTGNTYHNYNFKIFNIKVYDQFEVLLGDWDYECEFEPNNCGNHFCFYEVSGKLVNTNYVNPDEQDINYPNVVGLYDHYNMPTDGQKGSAYISFTIKDPYSSPHTAWNTNMTRGNTLNLQNWLGTGINNRITDINNPPPGWNSVYNRFGWGVVCHPCGKTNQCSNTWYKEYMAEVPYNILLQGCAVFQGSLNVEYPSYGVLGSPGYSPPLGSAWSVTGLCASNINSSEKIISNFKPSDKYSDDDNKCKEGDIYNVLLYDNTSIKSSSRRQKFINDKKPKETGPFAILGYYPLYDTIEAAVYNSPIPIESRTGEDTYGYHIHEFEGVEYYMPNGLEMGVTQFHGDYDGQIIPETIIQEQQVEEVIEPVQELPSVVTITPIEPEQEEEIPPPPQPLPTPTPTPTYTPPPSTPSGGSGGSGSGGY